MVMRDRRWARHDGAHAVATGEEVGDDARDGDKGIRECGVVKETRSDDRGADLLVGVAATLGVVGLALALMVWFAGQLSGVLSGKRWPRSDPTDAVHVLINAVTHPTRLTDGWPEAARSDLGPVWLILACLAFLMIGLGYAVWKVTRFALDFRRRREPRLLRLGFASGSEIAETLSAAAVLRKASQVRPSSAQQRRVDPREVGFFLGRDRRSRHDLYASVEDVCMVLAPPRQGKDVHFCAPFTIDAPGPCIVTSTRSDAFTNTYAQRAKLGKVYVFDPNNMTYWPERLRWSPVRGCQNPIVASRRATALIIGAGLEIVGEAAFYVAKAVTVLRCFLHAASFVDKTIHDVHMWLHDQTNPEPVHILEQAEKQGLAAPGWAQTLAGVCFGMQAGQRGDIFANASVGLDCFADPAVVEACSPARHEAFDIREFLSGRNTLYVLGKEQKNGSIAPVVTAMMEDLFEGARKVATSMPGSRLDPPLTVELNEAAHIAPLPSLPGYMGDSGGFSIALHVYLQSLSQAREKWGEHAAMVMWDNAAIRVVMGGAGNVEDLEHISKLIGERDDQQTNLLGLGAATWSGMPKRVLSAKEIRTLQFGSALVVARSTRPVEAVLTPWWKRPDGEEIAAGKAETERAIRRYTDDAERRATARLESFTFMPSMSGPSSTEITPEADATSSEIGPESQIPLPRLSDVEFRRNNAHG
jgi:type IV secretory pathway TraG/TraD family ATPase VirD4